MKNKIDQFFKEKLQGHALPPSDSAWAKVEAGLSKKNNIGIWRIAAAVFIAGALIVVIIGKRDTIKNPPLAANNKKTDSHRVTKNIVPAERKNTVQLMPSRTIHQSKRRTGNEIKKPEAAVASVEIKILAVDQQVASLEKNNKEENKKREATESVVTASTRQKPIKLEFTLEDFSAEPVATVNEIKTSKFKKVWELAREVKNGDGPVREIKNELFAFNFRKNRNQ